MINKLQERSLKIILNGIIQVVLMKCLKHYVVCNYHRNIQTLLIEAFKIKNELAPPIMESMFNSKFNTYNLRNFQEFKMDRKGTV